MVKLKNYHITITVKIRDINHFHANKTAQQLAEKINGRIYNVIDENNKDVTEYKYYMED